MTKKELIEKLKDIPADAEISFNIEDKFIGVPGLLTGAKSAQYESCSFIDPINHAIIYFKLDKIIYKNKTLDPIITYELNK